MSYTPKQIENLKVAYAVMGGIPAKRINLDLYRTKPYACDPLPNDKAFLNDCGSAGCIAGWLSAHPHFKAQGLRVPRDGRYPTIGRMETWEAAQRLFGDSYMFNSGHSGALGKREALERIRETLVDAEAITPKRDAQLENQEYRMRK